MTKFELPEKPKKTNTSEDFNNLRKAVDELDKFDYAWKTYANKADRRIDAANKLIEELKRENQRLVAENMAIKTSLEEAKKQPKVEHMNYCEPSGKNEQQALPLLPDYVAKFISDLKTRGDDLSYAFWCEQEDCASDDYNKAIVWMDSHPDDFARAWLDGYTAEKPKTPVSPCPVCGYKDVSSNFCSICGHKNEYVEDEE